MLNPEYTAATLALDTALVRRNKARRAADKAFEAYTRAEDIAAKYQAEYERKLHEIMAIENAGQQMIEEEN